MPVVAIVGGQWGDEGKGRVVDFLAEKADVVARFSGGDNAGHTIINPYGEFRLHLVPSGIFRPHTTCIVGNGVVVNPPILLEEIDNLQKHGVATNRLFISDRAHLVMPYHVLLDGLEEERCGDKALGTTRRGIGPAFSDKIARMGIRTGDLLDKDAFRNRLSSIMELKNAILGKVYGKSPLSVDEVFEQYCHYRDKLHPFIRDTGSIIREAIRNNELVLLEGAQGTLLDPDFGTYPYVTSSSPLAGGGSLGLGISPREINHIVGVFKAYITRVGSGPMPTELKDEVGELIRRKAHEYGATTGRPRRCGWFDAVAGKFSVEVNGFTELALTHLDTFDGFPSIKICTAYRLGSEILDSFPSDIAVLEKCQPTYEELSGWEELIGGIADVAQLPSEARRYLTRLEELLCCPISLVSVGSKREQMIKMRPILLKF